MAIYKGENLLASSANSDALVRNPDWGNAVTLTAADIKAGYVCPADGIIVVVSTGSSTTQRGILINGVEVARSDQDSSLTACANVQAPVAKGDVITTDTPSGFSIKAASFVPYGLYTAPDTLVPHNYSQDEQFTGNYWIDGKKIYRKSGIYNNGGSTGTGTVILDSTLTSSYVDTVISTGGCGTTSSNSKLPIGGYSGDPYRTVIYPGTNGLTKASSTDVHTNFKWWIEYTKTTD